MGQLRSVALGLYHFFAIALQPYILRVAKVQDLYILHVTQTPLQNAAAPASKTDIADFNGFFHGNSLR